MRKASRDLALCGVLCALAVAIMAMGTILPAATYCCPVLASMTLVPVLILCGERLSWAMFAASAILSLLLAPDKEAAAIFLALGYYPIVKPKLDRMKKPRRAALKLLLFNAAIFAVYGALLFIFRLDALREELAKGLSFAAARESAARALIGEDAAVLREPNDILGVEYCKALLQSGSTIAPLAILRKVVGHNGGAAKGFASASHIRELLTNGEDASAYLTAESAAIYARECAAGRAPVTMQNAERAVLSRLRAMCEEDFARYDSGNEGLYRRFYDAARTAASVDELLSAVKTKRYAYARLRRMLLAAYLDVTAADVPPEVPYLRVLACNERGRKLLKTIKKTGSAPVLTKSADVRALSEEAQKLFALTARAADQYVLAYPELRAARGSSAWTEGPVIV